MRFAAILSLIVASLVTTPPAHADTQRYCIGCSFEKGALAGSDFSGATYVGANFAGADVQRASFKDARLVAINFENADLTGAAFDGAQCTACNFEGAKLDGATFLGAKMTAANFSGFAATVDDANLRALLGGCVACSFRGARLSRRDLSGVALISVDLARADLRNTKFDGAVLCWNEIDGAARALRCDPMTGAQLDGASFAGVRVCDDPVSGRGCTVVDEASRLRAEPTPSPSPSP